jgi:MFS family permease
VNVPIGLVGMLAALLFVPRSRQLQVRVNFDWPGFSLFFPAVAALVFAVSEGDRLGWTSPAMAALLGGTALLVAAFVVRERRCRAPMIDGGLFRRRRFTAGVSSSLLAFLVMFGVLVVVPFYLERAIAYGTARTGLELMVMPLALGLVAPFSGRLTDALGPRLPSVAGLGLAAAGLVTLGALRPSTVGFLVLLAVVGAGFGLFISPNNAGIMAAVPADQSGLASGLLNMSRGLGTAMGLAVASAVFSAAGGDGGAPLVVRQAFSYTLFVLAGVAVLAAVTAALAGRARIPSDESPPPAERRAAMAGVVA